jgi:hypothetical protein
MRGAAARDRRAAFLSTSDLRRAPDLRGLRHATEKPCVEISSDHHRDSRLAATDCGDLVAKNGKARQ